MEAATRGKGFYEVCLLQEFPGLVTDQGVVAPVMELSPTNLVGTPPLLPGSLIQDCMVVAIPEHVWMKEELWWVMLLIRKKTLTHHPKPGSTLIFDCMAAAIFHHMDVWKEKVLVRVWHFPVHIHPYPTRNFRVFIYIYIEREREREITLGFIYIYMYMK